MESGGLYCIHFFSRVKRDK